MFFINLEIQITAMNMMIKIFFGCGLLIEGNFLDHNGWNESLTDANPTVYNHNLYTNVGVKNLVVKDNILTHAST